MSDYGQKFHHAGTPDPADLPVAQTSDVSPHGWAGVSGFSRPDTVEVVGQEYGGLVQAARDAALSKREAELMPLHGDVGENYPHHIRGYGD